VRNESIVGAPFSHFQFVYGDNMGVNGFWIKNIGRNINLPPFFHIENEYIIVSVDYFF